MVTGLLGLTGALTQIPFRKPLSTTGPVVAALAYKVQNDSGVPPVVRGDGGCRAASRCAMCLPTVGIKEA